MAELYTPVAGEIVEVNGTAVEDRGDRQRDPQGEGWLVRIRFSTDSDLKHLMNAEAYEKYVQAGEG